ncbi:DNA-methyltransferase [Myceligenerans crystallogenes]|uniref:Methyltransferase n=1 Tax=Myceligenerans crystallogenes TaxID=316335 RepID=A0ABN2N634_9MICO
MDPYDQDETVTLYCGDAHDVVPALGRFDAVVTDPPYGVTPLAWDVWPEGWPALVAAHATSMWCFAPVRVLLERAAEFDAAGWRFSQDVVWRKPNGTGIAPARFRRVHETATHWYRGPWTDTYHATPRVPGLGPRKQRAIHRTAGPATQNTQGASSWSDDGTRQAPSVIDAANLHRRQPIHPTEKPTGLLELLIAYATPPEGVVLDPFAGSGSTAVAARHIGRRAVLVEAREQQCEMTALRLAQGCLDLGI